ncbi:MAG: DUF4258 domain-containing protein [Candidatus Aenigmarchaeota archaeon]|nr:DUF4258 domain-containing protein [Candidatus Aenigmarchaeota archaeon]
MELQFTKHALEQMLERGVSKYDVREILLKGVKFGPDSKGSLHARMYGIEVVYVKSEGVYRVITIFRLK